MTTQQAVLCLSGGLDSVTLLHYAHKALGFDKVHCASFHYGQRHLKELACAEWQADLFDDHFMEIPMPPLEYSAAKMSALSSFGDIPVPALDQVMGDPQPVTYVPFRNLVFLASCLSIAEAVGATRVLYGAQRHDLYGYWDTTPEFVKAVNGVVELDRRNKMAVDAPFVSFSKADVLKWGLANGVDYSKTWSCYKGEERPCGVCPTCRERLAAFEANGVTDPLMT